MSFKQIFLQDLTNQIVNTPMQGVSQNTKQHLNSLTEYLLTPSVSPKALGLTYATIKYWETKGYLILSLPKEADEWRKYSVIELLWFQLLKKVVEMGCAIEKVAPRLIFAFANYKGVSSAMQFTDQQTPVMVVEGVRVNPLNNFLTHILLTITARSKSALNVNDTGFQFYFQGSDRVALANEAYNTIFTTGITINISDLLFGYILGADANTQNKMQIFNDQEAVVVRALGKSNISQITIKQDDGKIYELQTAEKFAISDLNKYVSNFITNDYQELSFKTNNNKHFSLVRTTKQKL